MKKIVTYLVLTGIIVSCFVSCAKPAMNEKVKSPGKVIENEQTIAIKTSEPTKAPMKKTAQSKSNEEYSENTYYIGKDVEPGKYAVRCSASKYDMQIIIFKNEDDYNTYLKINGESMGDAMNAIEECAYTEFFIKTEQSVYLNLKEGNVALTGKGVCEFEPYDVYSSTQFLSGLYVVGDDLKEGKISIKALNDRICIAEFENEEKYLDYHRSDRYTTVENSKAAEEHGKYTRLEKGYNRVIELTDGMILMIDDGTGEYKSF